MKNAALVESNECGYHPFNDDDESWKSVEG
jgi:hypothetical protein